MEPAASSPDEFAHLWATSLAALQVAMLDACAREVDWPAKVAAGVRAGLEFAAGAPPSVQVLVNEALAHGVGGVERYERLVAYLGEYLNSGRDERPEGRRLPDITERAMTGGVLMLVAQRVDQGRASELPALVPEAIQFVLTPYVGAEEARRVGLEFGAADRRPPTDPPG